MNVANEDRSSENLSPYTIEVLNEVAATEEYYVPLSLPSEDPLSVALKTLAAKDYIHWCPYPEEFYIVRSSGLAELNRRKGNPG